MVADSDRPMAAAHALRAGMRCEADAARRARAGDRPADVDAARRRGAALSGRMRDLLARPGTDHGWKREVRVLAAMCAGEASRIDGATDPQAWAAAGRRAEALLLAYLLAYCRLRYGEAVLLTGDDRDAAATALRRAHFDARSMGARPLQQVVERVSRSARLGIGATVDGDNGFGITPREREVLWLLVQGATNRQIAHELFIAEKTASVHVSNIIRKLGVANRGQAVSLAHRHGLVDAAGM